MKFFKYLLYALILLLVILMLLVIYCHFAAKKSEGNIKLSGIYGPVSIQRDQYGIPHIYALKNDQDAFFALGYVHAQDRFWQMEMQRRIEQGTLSEIFGKKALDKDKFL